MTNHLIYFKIYNELNIFELLNIYYSGIYRDGIIDYLNTKSAKFWSSISILNLSNDFLHTFSSKIDWVTYIRSFSQEDDEDIFVHKMCWNSIKMRDSRDLFDIEIIDQITRNIELDAIPFIKQNSFDINFLREFDNNLPWYIVSCNFKLTVEMLKEFETKIFWRSYSRFNEHITDDVIINFPGRLNWQFLTMRIKMTEYTLRLFKDKIDWEIAPCTQTLPEDLIYEYIEKNENLSNLFRFQKLSEELINNYIKNKGPTYLSRIITYQEVSDNFILRNLSYLDNDDIRDIIRNKKISENILLKLTDLDINFILDNQCVSDDFIINYIERYGDETIDINSIIINHNPTDKLLEYIIKNCSNYDLDILVQICELKGPMIEYIVNVLRYSVDLIMENQSYTVSDVSSSDIQGYSV